MCRYASSTDPRIFRHIRRFSGQGNLPLILSLGSQEASTEQKASLFNQYFYTVFSSHTQFPDSSECRFLKRLSVLCPSLLKKPALLSSPLIPLKVWAVIVSHTSFWNIFLQSLLRASIILSHSVFLRHTFLQNSRVTGLFLFPRLVTDQHSLYAVVFTKC